MLWATAGPWRTAIAAVGGQAGRRRPGAGPRRNRRSPRRRSCPRPASARRPRPARPRRAAARASPARRVGLHARGPDEGPRGHPLAGREQRRGRGRLLEPGAEADVDPAAAELAQRRSRRGRLRHLRQHPVHRLDQDPAHAVQAGPRVAVHRVGGEVLKLGERLEARVAAADEDVGEQLLAARRVLGGVRRLERLDQVVSQPDRVGEALEADRVPVEAGNRQRARDRADRDQQLVVADRLDLALVRVGARPCAPRGRGRRSRRAAGWCA